jgi:predicted GTPase
MGYGPEQIHDLERTINGVDCDLVLIATPVDLRRLINIKQPNCRVHYEFEDSSGKLRSILTNLLAKRKSV